MKSVLLFINNLPWVVIGQVVLLRNMGHALHTEQSLKLSYVKILFDLSRGKQALLSICQPALGAFFALGRVPDLHLLAIGIPAAACGYFAVFSLNDVLDVKADKQALTSQSNPVDDGYDIDVTFLRHPLAHGKISFRTSLAWVIGLALVSATLAYILSPVSFLLFLGCVALETLYCALRSITWLKTIISGIMVGLGGLAGWATATPLTVASLYLFLFLALWEIAGRNLPNDLADVDSDRLVGIKTVATIFGGRVSSVATLIGALATLASINTLPISLVPKLIIILLGAWAMVIPAILLVQVPSSTQAASYFNKASLLPSLAFIAIIPFMLLRSL
ncbi:MAG TPA: UbiA prenyltransferase family protein [Anaerolineae bacterium]|nr:UbiA prenyltransferase family protein [Anaerolineae bacterium]